MSSQARVQLLKACGAARDLVRGRQLHAELQASGLASDRFIANHLIDMYSRCGSIDEARDAFNAVACPNVFSWNILAQAYARYGLADETIGVFQAMPRRDLFSWSTAVTAQALSGDVDLAKRFLDKMPQHDAVCWALIVQTVAKTGDLQTAKHVFDTSPHRGPSSWLALLTAFAGSGGTDQAVAVLEKMPSHDAASATIVLQTVAQTGDLLKAERIFSSMDEADLLAWTALLTAYARCGCMDGAWWAFQEMPSRDAVTWTLLVHAFAQSGEAEQAEQTLLQRMPAHGIGCWNAVIASSSSGKEAIRLFFHPLARRDVASWTSIVAALGQEGRVDDALRTFRIMPCRDEIAWNAIVSALATNDRIELAREMYKAMPSSGSSAWRAIAAAYSRRGEVDAAIELCKEQHCDEGAWEAEYLALVEGGELVKAKEMLFSGRRATMELWTALLCAHARDDAKLVEARPLFRRMPQHDAVSSAAMVDALGRMPEAERTPEEPKTVFNSMPYRDAMVWTSLVVAMSRSGRLDETWQALHRSPASDVVSWTAAMAAFARAGNISRAREMFESCPPEHRDDACWGSMLGAYVRAGETQAMESVLLESAPAEASPWSSAVAACGRQGQPQRALMLLREMQLAGVGNLSDALLAALNACSHGGLLDECLDCLCSCSELSLLEQEHYHCIVDVLARSGLLSEAEQVVEAMPFAPNATTWNVVMSGCRLHGEADRGARAGRAAIDSDLVDSGTMALLSNVYAAANQL